MTEGEARYWGTRFIDTWPSGARAYVWRDLFQTLDVALVAGVYTELERDVIRGAPTPGQFHETYTALRRVLQPAPTVELDLADENVIDPAQGMAIARQAYTVECRLQGRDPSWAHFNRTMP